MITAAWIALLSITNAVLASNEPFRDIITFQRPSPGWIGIYFICIVVLVIVAIIITVSLRKSFTLSNGAIQCLLHTTSLIIISPIISRTWPTILLVPITIVIMQLTIVARGWRSSNSILKPWLQKGRWLTLTLVVGGLIASAWFPFSVWLFSTHVSPRAVWVLFLLCIAITEPFAMFTSMITLLHISTLKDGVRNGSWWHLLQGLLDFTTRDITYLIGGFIYALIVGD
jgi:hypothetical protein